MTISYSNILFYFINQISNMPLIVNKESLKFDDILVQSDVEIKEFVSTSQNRVFSLISSKEQPKFNFLLKQPKILNEQNQLCIRKESVFYELAVKKISEFIPKFYNYNSIDSIEIIQFIDETKSLNERLNNEYSDDLLKNVAGVLKKVHQGLENLTTDSTLQTKLSIFMSQYPLPIFLLPEKLEEPEKFEELDFYSSINPLLLPYSRFLKKYEFYYPIVQKGISNWNQNKDTQLIHGDLGLRNILFRETDQGIFFIDWENALYGDIYFDLAYLKYSLILKLGNLNDWDNGIKKALDSFSIVIEEYEKNISKENIEKINQYVSVLILDFCITHVDLSELHKSLLLDLSIIISQ
jgi:thiamine kinase-like enzyme